MSNNLGLLPSGDLVTLLVRLMIKVNVHLNTSGAKSERLHLADILRFLKEQTQVTMTPLALALPQLFSGRLRRPLRTISRGIFTFGLETKLMTVVIHLVLVLGRFSCTRSSWTTLPWSNLKDVEMDLSVTKNLVNRQKGFFEIQGDKTKYSHLSGNLKEKGNTCLPLPMTTGTAGELIKNQASSSSNSSE